MPGMNGTPEALQKRRRNPPAVRKEKNDGQPSFGPGTPMAQLLSLPSSARSKSSEKSSSFFFAVGSAGLRSSPLICFSLAVATEGSFGASAAKVEAVRRLASGKRERRFMGDLGHLAVNQSTVEKARCKVWGSTCTSQSTLKRGNCRIILLDVFLIK